jgi:hypothetical protein
LLDQYQQGLLPFEHRYGHYGTIPENSLPAYVEPGAQTVPTQHVYCDVQPRNGSHNPGAVLPLTPDRDYDSGYEFGKFGSALPSWTTRDMRAIDEHLKQTIKGLKATNERQKQTIKGLKATNEHQKQTINNLKAQKQKVRDLEAAVEHLTTALNNTTKELESARKQEVVEYKPAIPINYTTLASNVLEWPSVQEVISFLPQDKRRDPEQASAFDRVERPKISKPDFNKDTVWRCVESFKESILSMHPFLQPEDVDRWCQRLSRPQTDTTGTKRKRAPEIEAHEANPHQWKPGLPNNRVSTAVILTILALGKICLDGRPGADAIPGLEYFSLATTVRERTKTYDSMECVYLHILTALYLGQLALPKHSHAQILKAGKMLLSLLRP